MLFFLFVPFASVLGSEVPCGDTVREGCQATAGQVMLQAASRKAKTHVSQDKRQEDVLTAPVCEAWKLVIAAENTNWEAHIFEIELWSGTTLVSGSGFGTASDDCTRNGRPSANAFDGDTSSKWETCSGNKVGKSVTYVLNSPNGVTKVKAQQISSSGNAIPKFDLFCDNTTDVFYVWTADLGSGAGTNEAYSDLLAPTAADIEVFKASTTPTTTTTTTLPAYFFEKARLFITEGRYSMDMGGIAAADAICTAEAGQPAKALLADETGCEGAPCRTAATMSTWPPTVGRTDWPVLPSTTYYSFDFSHAVAKTSCYGLFSEGLAPLSDGPNGNTASGLNKDWGTVPGATCDSFTSLDAEVTVGWYSHDSVSTTLLVGQSWTTVGCGSMPFACVTLLPEADYAVIPTCPELVVEKLENYYAHVAGGGSTVWAFQGPRLAITVPEDAVEALNMDPADPGTQEAMGVIVAGVEQLLALYDDVVGKTPMHFMADERLAGRATMEIANSLGSAAGIAKHGVAGCGIGASFLREALENAMSGKFVLEQIMAYEFMRNYIFEEFSAFLYHTDDDESSWGWVNQAVINSQGILLADKLGFEVNYAGLNREQFLQSMKDQLYTYLGNPQYNVNNTFLKHLLPWNQYSSVDNLWSGILHVLYEDCGGYDFSKGFFHVLPDLRPLWPATSYEYEKALSNFYIASSVGCNADLKSFFGNDLKFPLTQAAMDFVASKGLAPRNITIAPPEE